MPGMFIDVRVAPELAADPERAAKLVEICPVGIFAMRDGRLHVVEENLDECVLCDLCSEAEPGAVRVVKLYEE